MPPVQVTLTSDAYSQGSGLASSSSYIISLIKLCIFKDQQMTDSEICKLAYELELKFNPYCGYQDPYGCGMGGFKRMEFFQMVVSSMNIFLRNYLRSMICTWFSLV